jgi:pyruvate/2-oxoglutarate dehydrogenase complex dihydrolipoamide dehydrogenase (E3) component
MADRVLGREDEEVSALAASVLAEAGVKVLTEHRAARFEAGALCVFEKP